MQEADKILDKVNVSLDLVEVEKLIGDFTRFLYNNYIRIPICQINVEVGTTKDIPEWDLGARGFGKNLNGLIKR